MLDKFKENRAEKHAERCQEERHSWKHIGTETAHTFGGDSDIFAYKVETFECRWCYIRKKQSPSSMCPEYGAVDSIVHSEEADPGYNSETCSNCGKTEFHDFSCPCAA